MCYYGYHFDGGTSDPKTEAPVWFINKLQILSSHWGFDGQLMYVMGNESVCHLRREPSSISMIVNARRDLLQR